MALSPGVQKGLHIPICEADSSQVHIQLIPETGWKPISEEMLDSLSNMRKEIQLCSSAEDPNSFLFHSKDGENLSQCISNGNEECQPQDSEPMIHLHEICLNQDGFDSKIYIDPASQNRPRGVDVSTKSPNPEPDSDEPFKSPVRDLALINTEIDEVISCSFNSEEQSNEKLIQAEIKCLTSSSWEDVGVEYEPGTSTGRLRLGQDNLRTDKKWSLINIEPLEFESGASSYNHDLYPDSMPGPSRIVHTTIIKKPRSIIKQPCHDDWKFINVEESVNVSYVPEGNDHEIPFDIFQTYTTEKEFQCPESKKHVHFDPASDFSLSDIYDDFYPTYRSYENYTRTANHCKSIDSLEAAPLILGLTLECISSDMDLSERAQPVNTNEGKNGDSPTDVNIVTNMNASANNDPLNNKTDFSYSSGIVGTSNSSTDQQDRGLCLTSAGPIKRPDSRSRSSNCDLKSLQQQEKSSHKHAAQPQSFTEKMVAMFNNMQNISTLQASNDKFKRKEHTVGSLDLVSFNEKYGCAAKKDGFKPPSNMSKSSSAGTIISLKTDQVGIDLQKLTQGLETSSSKYNAHSVKAILLVLNAMRTVLMRMAKLAAGADVSDQDLKRASKSKAKVRCPKDREVMPDSLFAYSIAYQVVGQACKKLLEHYPEYTDTLQTLDEKKIEQKQNASSFSNLMALTAMRDALKDLEGPLQEKTYTSVAVETSDSLTSCDASDIQDEVTNETKESESFFIVISIINEMLDNIIIVSMLNKDNHVKRSESGEEIKNKNELLSLLKTMSNTLVAKTMREAASVLTTRKATSSSSETTSSHQTKEDQSSDGNEILQIIAPGSPTYPENTQKKEEQSLTHFIDRVSYEVQSLISHVFDHLQNIDSKEELNAAVTESEANISRSLEQFSAALFQNTAEKFVQTEMQQEDELVDTFSSNSILEADIPAHNQVAIKQKNKRCLLENIETCYSYKTTEITMQSAEIMKNVPSVSSRKSPNSDMLEDEKLKQSKLSYCKHITDTSLRMINASTQKDDLCRSDDSTQCLTAGSQDSESTSFDQKLSTFDSHVSATVSTPESGSSFEYPTPSNLLQMRLLDEQLSNVAFEAPTLFGNLQFARSHDRMFMFLPPGRVQMDGGNHPEHVQQADVNRPSCSKVQTRFDLSCHDTVQTIAKSYSDTDPTTAGKRRTLPIENGYGLANHLQQRGAKIKNNRSASEPKLDFYKRTYALQCPPKPRKVLFQDEVESSEWMLVGNQSISEISNNDSEAEDDDLFTVEFGEGVTSEEAELIMGIIFPMPHEIVRQDVIEDSEEAHVQSATESSHAFEDINQYTTISEVSTIAEEQVRQCSQDAESLVKKEPTDTGENFQEGRSGRLNPTPNIAINGPDYDETQALMGDVHKTLSVELATSSYSSQISCSSKDLNVHSLSYNNSTSTVSTPSASSEHHANGMQEVRFQEVGPSKDQVRECSACPSMQSPSHSNTALPPGAARDCICQLSSSSHHGCCQHGNTMCRQSLAWACQNHSSLRFSEACPVVLEPCFCGACWQREVIGRCRSHNCSTSADEKSDSEKELDDRSSRSVQDRESFDNLQENQRSKVCPRSSGRTVMRCCASVCASKSHSYHCYNAPVGIHPCHTLSAGINPCCHCGCHSDFEVQCSHSPSVVSMDHCYSLGSKDIENNSLLDEPSLSGECNSLLVEPCLVPLQKLKKASSLADLKCREENIGTSCCQHFCTASSFNMFTCNARPRLQQASKYLSSSDYAFDSKHVCRHTCALKNSSRMTTDGHGVALKVQGHGFSSELSHNVCECNESISSSVVHGINEAAHVRADVKSYKGSKMVEECKKSGDLNEQTQELPTQCRTYDSALNQSQDNSQHDSVQLSPETMRNKGHHDTKFETQCYTGIAPQSTRPVADSMPSPSFLAEQITGHHRTTFLDTQISLCQDAVCKSKSSTNMAHRAVEAILNSGHLNQEGGLMPPVRIAFSNVDCKNLLLIGKDGIKCTGDKLFSIMSLKHDACVQANLSEEFDLSVFSDSDKIDCASAAFPKTENDLKECRAFIVFYTNDCSTIYIHPLRAAERKAEYEDHACQVSFSNICEDNPVSAASDGSDISVSRSTILQSDEEEDVPEDLHENEQCQFSVTETCDTKTYSKKKSRQTLLSANRISILEEVCEISHSGCETCLKNSSPKELASSFVEPVLFKCRGRNNHRCPTSSSESDLEYNCKKYSCEKAKSIFVQSCKSGDTLRPYVELRQLSDRAANWENPEYWNRSKDGDSIASEALKTESIASFMISEAENETSLQQSKMGCNAETPILTTLECENVEVLKHDLVSSKSETDIAMGNRPVLITLLPSSSSSFCINQTTSKVSSESFLSLRQASSCSLSMSRTTSCVGHSVSGLDIQSTKKLMVANDICKGSLCSGENRRVFDLTDSKAVSMRKSESKDMVHTDSHFGNSRDTWTSLQMLNLNSRATRMVLENHVAALHQILHNLELTDASLSRQLLLKASDLKMISDEAEYQQDKRALTEKGTHKQFFSTGHLTQSSCMQSQVHLTALNDHPSNSLNSKLELKSPSKDWELPEKHLHKEENLLVRPTKIQENVNRFSEKKVYNNDGSDLPGEQCLNSKLVSNATGSHSVPECSSSAASLNSTKDDHQLRPCTSEELIWLVNQQLDGLKQKLQQYSEKVSRGTGGSLNINTNNCPSEIWTVTIKPEFPIRGTFNLNNILSVSVRHPKKTQTVGTVIQVHRNNIIYSNAKVDIFGFNDFDDETKGDHSVSKAGQVLKLFTSASKSRLNIENYNQKACISICGNDFNAPCDTAWHNFPLNRKEDKEIQNFSDGVLIDSNSCIKTCIKGVHTDTPKPPELVNFCDNFSKYVSRGGYTPERQKGYLTSFNHGFACKSKPLGQRLVHNPINVVSGETKQVKIYNSKEEKQIHQYKNKIKGLERALKQEKDLHAITKASLETLVRDHNSFRARISQLRENRERRGPSSSSSILN